jgi:hypothetical protein
MDQLIQIPFQYRFKLWRLSMDCERTAWADKTNLPKRKIDNIEIGRTGLKINDIEKLSKSMPKHLYWVLTGVANSKEDMPDLVEQLLGRIGEEFSYEEMLKMIEEPNKAPDEIAKLLRVEKHNTEEEIGSEHDNEAVLARGGN